MVSSSGRIAARTRIVVTNCVTGDVSYDQAIRWTAIRRLGQRRRLRGRARDVVVGVVPQELARYPVFFPRVSRIRSVQSPFAYVDTVGGLYAVGDTLRAFAGSGATHRPPILLTVTSIDGKYVQAVFSTVNDAATPEAGDYVEPVTKPAATPSLSRRRAAVVGFSFKKCWRERLVGNGVNARGACSLKQSRRRLRVSVGVRHLREAEVVLDVAEDARFFVLDVRHVVLLRVR